MLRRQATARPLPKPDQQHFGQHPSTTPSRSSCPSANLLWLVVYLLVTPTTVPPASGEYLPGSFKGQLVAAENFPIGNIQVLAYKGRDPSTKVGTPYTGVTDAAGFFSVPNLPLGDYVVHFVPPHSTKPLKTTAISLTEVNPIPYLRVSLGRFTTFRVRLLKGSDTLSGEVYLNGRTYGQGSLSKQLLTVAGTHRVTAKSDACKVSEERVETFFPSTERILDIQLTCKD